MTKSILIVGVGGQGTLLTGRIIGEYALSKGYDIKMSEVHGMAQRGGSVVMQIKYGTTIYSPLIEEGEADIIFAFEKLEALRYVPFLKKDGVLIVNTQEINPMSVVMGVEAYPKEIEKKLKETCKRVCLIDALAMAQQLGNSRVANMIMIGAYAAYVEEPLEIWGKIVENIVPFHTKQINKEALKKGYMIYMNQ